MNETVEECNVISSHKMFIDHNYN